MTTKNPAEQGVKDNGPDGLALSDSELKAARKDGAKEDAKEAAKDAHRALTDGFLGGEPANDKYLGYEESQPYAYWLDGSVDSIKQGRKDNLLTDVQLYGLLALERNGKNRTEYVKFFVDELGLKKDLEKGQSLASVLPGGGPSYTEDTTNLTEL